MTMKEMMTAIEWAKPVSMLPFGVLRLRMHANQLSVCSLRLSSCCTGAISVRPGGCTGSGFAAADPALFDGSAWVLCLELQETSLPDWLTLAALYTGLGARVVPMTALDPRSCGTTRYRGVVLTVSKSNPLLCERLEPASLAVMFFFVMPQSRSHHTRTS